MCETRYSSFQHFENTIFETTSLLDKYNPCQPILADTLYSENNGKSCIPNLEENISDLGQYVHLALIACKVLE